MTARRRAPVRLTAAAWPLILAGSVVLVAVVVAAPLIVHAWLDERIGGPAATWIAVGTGLGALVVLASAWVLARTHRESQVLRSR